jgi:hypothetical protein
MVTEGLPAISPDGRFALVAESRTGNEDSLMIYRLSDASVVAEAGEHMLEGLGDDHESIDRLNESLARILHGRTFRQMTRFRRDRECEQEQGGLCLTIPGTDLRATVHQEQLTVTTALDEGILFHSDLSQIAQEFECRGSVDDLTIAIDFEWGLLAIETDHYWCRRETHFYNLLSPTVDRVL